MINFVFVTVRGEVKINDQLRYPWNSIVHSRVFGVSYMMSNTNV